MKFDLPTTEAILQDLRDEIPYKIAAESNGVAYCTLESWINSGLKDIKEGKTDSKYALFVGAVRKIEKDRIKRHVLNINSNEKSHRGSEWILERAFWQHFSAKTSEIELNERVEKLESKKGDEINDNNKEKTSNDS
jgi:hypothetical protein